jgi:putative tryptophan/tyrosine transport system substrate-binding protein
MKKTKSYGSALGVIFFVTGLLLAAGAPLHAQTKHARVAILTPAQTLTPVHEGLEDGLSQLGYKQGKNITYIVEDTNGSSSNLAPRMPKLLAAKPDVIFAVSTVHALVAKRATSTVPIVCAWVADPIKAGLVASYFDVKSNLTGVAAIGDSLTGKRLEVLLSVAPKVKRLLAIVATAEGVSRSSVRSLDNTAKKFGIKITRWDVTTAAEVTNALRETPKGSVDAIFHIPSTLLRSNIDLLAKKARVDKIPLAIHEDSLLDRGALVSYGPNPRLIGLQAAALVDKVLKGIRPGEIPIETPDRFFLGINLRVAKELGLKIPDEILERADRLVE